MKPLTDYLDLSQQFPLTRQQLRETDRSTAALVLSSAIVAFLVMSPMLWLVFRATEVDPARAYSLIVSSQTGWITLNSIVLMAIVMLCSILLGVPLAVLTTRTDLPYPRLLDYRGRTPARHPQLHRCDRVRGYVRLWR